MERHEATCSCGQLRATAEGDPIRVSVCHCLACQRRTGSAFGVQARFAGEQVAVSGDWQEYVRLSDEDGEPRRFRFCGRCGRPCFTATAQTPVTSRSPSARSPISASSRRNVRSMSLDAIHGRRSAARRSSATPDGVNEGAPAPTSDQARSGKEPNSDRGHHSEGNSRSLRLTARLAVDRRSNRSSAIAGPAGAKSR